ncbi:carboxylesterase family protein [Paraburkholderia aspalathi]|uniref:carboxylesterase/lipase family protein n=1 Tax=Paraburkholderia aspalathi TaxID=1324617 RepID=UPI0038B97843
MTIFRFRAHVFALIFVGLTACGGGINQGADAADPLIVKTAQGPVSGVKNGDVISFLGMPYAQAPVGSLRWRPTQAPSVRTTAFNATAYGKACPQTTVNNNIAAADMSEDCLFINVQKPASAPATGKLPVLVYIHGGAFTLGSGAQVDGSTIATTGNIIYVSFNYRLGALGYLANKALQASTQDSNLGNFAVMDQQAALRWIQQNISAFGGDPTNVTVWGLSAGSTSTFTLLESPLSKGLFAKAAMESGAGGPYSNLSPAAAEAQGGLLVTALGCDQSSDVAACLRSQSADALVAAQGSSRWRPTVDGSVVTQVPADAFAAGTFNQVPVMIGGVYDEGTIFVPTNLTAAQYAPAIKSLAPAGFDTTGILAAYPLSSYAVPSQGYARAMGDAIYSCSNRSRRDDLSSWVPVYGWEYTDPSLSFPANPTSFYLGTSHGSDALFWFGPADTPTTNPVTGVAGPIPVPAMQALGVQMKKYLVNFVRVGNPNGSVTDPSLPQWPRYTGPNNRAVLELTTPSITLDTTFDTDHKCNTVWGKDLFPETY